MIYKLVPIRMTFQQREYLHALAKDRGLTLQAYCFQQLFAPRIDSEPLTYQERWQLTQLQESGKLTVQPDGVSLSLCEKLAKRNYAVLTKELTYKITPLGERALLS